MDHKQQQRIRKHKRIRAKISGTQDRPRCVVYKSNKALSAQLVDDTTGTTLLSVTTFTLQQGTKTEKARQLGEKMAKEALAKNITSIVFDRGGFEYTGIIKEFADTARKIGLAF